MEESLTLVACARAMFPEASAAQALGDALRADPYSAEAHFLLGKIYSEQQRPDLGIKEYERAILTATPTDPVAAEAQTQIDLLKNIARGRVP